MHLKYLLQNYITNSAYIVFVNSENFLKRFLYENYLNSRRKVRFCKFHNIKYLKKTLFFSKEKCMKSVFNKIIS